MDTVPPGGGHRWKRRVLWCVDLCVSGNPHLENPIQDEEPGIVAAPVPRGINIGPAMLSVLECACRCSVFAIFSFLASFVAKPMAYVYVSSLPFLELL